MPDYSQMSLKQLEAERKRNEENMADAKLEREFMGKQAGQHISVSEFARIDRDIERYEERIQELSDLIEKAQD